MGQPEPGTELSSAFARLADQGRIAELLARLRAIAASEEFLLAQEQLERLKAAALQLDRSFCGSWRGGNARIYYAGFRPPPLGVVFRGSLETRQVRNRLAGGWRSYESSEVRAQLIRQGADPDLTRMSRLSEQVDAEFRTIRRELTELLEGGGAPGAKEVVGQIDMLEPVSATLIVRLWAPTSETTSDELAPIVPPAHLMICAEVAAIKHSFAICEVASRVVSGWLARSET